MSKIRRFLNYFINLRSNEFFVEKLLEHIQEPQNETENESDTARGDAKDDTESETENFNEDDTEIVDGRNDTEGGDKSDGGSHSEVDSAHSGTVGEDENGSRPNSLPNVILASDTHIKNLIQKAREDSLRSVTITDFAANDAGEASSSKGIVSQEEKSLEEFAGKTTETQLGKGAPRSSQKDEGPTPKKAKKKKHEKKDKEERKNKKHTKENEKPHSRNKNETAQVPTSTVVSGAYNAQMQNLTSSMEGEPILNDKPIAESTILVSVTTQMFQGIFNFILFIYL